MKKESESKAMQKLLKFTGVVFLYSIVFQLFYNWMRYYTPWPYEELAQLVESATMNFVPMWVMAMLIWTIVWYVPAPRRTWAKIAVDLCLTAVAMTAVNFLFKIVTGAAVEWGGTAFNATFLYLGTISYYNMRKYTESIKEQSEAREEALRYRYDALRAHIDPHFLFNSLNILSSLIVVKPEASQDFIIALSRLYRYVMTKQNCEIVTVDEELEFLRNYVEILEMRYDPNLSVDLKVDPAAKGHKLIPFSLQLLMENVIKHNVISKAHPMHVTIEVSAEGVRFVNPVKALKAETKSNVGGKYLSKLYALHGSRFEAGMQGDQFIAYLTYIS